MEKFTLLSIVGIIGGYISSFFAGVNTMVLTLIIFMIIDYITGVICAVFNKSEKTENGGLDSKVGWRGICKKVITILLVLVANRLDVVIGTDYIMDCVIFGFMANEIISIIENSGIMGVPIPEIIRKAIAILNSKGEKIDE